MLSKKPITRIMSASQVRQHFAETINDVARGNTRVIIEKNGAPSGAVISARDLERLEIEEEKWEADWKALDEMRASLPIVDPEELEREAAKALAEVRAEMDAEREPARNQRSHVA